MTRASGPSWARTAAPDRMRGFTLVEVLVASLILAVALIALSGLFAFGIKNNAVAKEDTVMAAFAQDKLEELKRSPLAELQKRFDPACVPACESGCDCATTGCDQTTCCEHVCYKKGCVSREEEYEENPIADPNPLDEIRENLYVRYWKLERVSLGQPVGCVLKITVIVGSRNGILAPKPPPPATTWINASAADVVGVKNPRRVVISTYRAR